MIDVAYFENENKCFLEGIRKQVPVFLSRFEGIDFTGKRILDLGCGDGSLTVVMAEKAAALVVGVDTNYELIEKFTKPNIENNYQHLKDRIQIINCKAEDLSENETFDMIISKASFEHILDLDKLMLALLKLLKKGGKIYTGYGPLYNSPWGDHKRLKHLLPWGHLIMPRTYFINKLNKNRKVKVNNIYDLGLNGLALKDYKRIFFNTDGLKVISFKTNVNTRLVSKLFKVLSFIPFMKEYFTHNIYCIMEKI